MNPANLKRYATRKYNLKLKEEAASDENYAINKIKDILEANGIDNEAAENYINDIFSFDSYEPYMEMTEQQILEDFLNWKLSKKKLWS
jgi:phosphopentomutase